MADLTEQIESDVAQPASASVDGVSVSSRPIADLIAADKYLKGNAAAANPLAALRFAKVVSPSSVGET